MPWTGRVRPGRMAAHLAAAAALCLAHHPGPGSAQMVWDRLPGNAVLEPGPAGAVDDVGAGDPTVVRHGQRYHMWYTTEGHAGRAIGYARSDDGLQWENYPGNPVIEDGVGAAWDAAVAIQPTVVYLAGQFRMWYAGHDGSVLGIGHATSSDGVTWMKQGVGPVLQPGADGAWDAAGVSRPVVIHDDNQYHMWYTGYDGSVLRIGHATGSNGVTWTRDAVNPVLDTGGAGSWDSVGVSAPAVIWDGRVFRMWYAGHDGVASALGYATSPDGSTWTRHPAPVLVKGAHGGWDSDGVGGPAVIRTGSVYRMWYSGHDGAGGSVGYASSRAPGDANGDGAISAMDAVLVLQYTVRIIDDFPVDELSTPKAAPLLPLYRVALTETRARAGERVQVRLSVDDATGLLAGGLKIVYDPSVLEAVEVLPRPLLNGSFWQANVDLPGEVRCAFAAARSLEGGGGLFQIDFETASGAVARETRLSIEEASFNGGPAVQISNGAVRLVPMSLRLAGNCPNPFNGQTRIRFELPEDGTVSLSIYGAGGQLVRRLVSGPHRSGYHEATWDGRDEDGRDVASGVYVSRLVSGDGLVAGKLLLLR